VFIYKEQKELVLAQNKLIFFINPYKSIIYNVEKSDAM